MAAFKFAAQSSAKCWRSCWAIPWVSSSESVSDPAAVVSMKSGRRGHLLSVRNHNWIAGSGLKSGTEGLEICTIKSSERCESLRQLRQSDLTSFIALKPRSASTELDGNVRIRSTRARTFGHLLPRAWFRRCHVSFCLAPSVLPNTNCLTATHSGHILSMSTFPLALRSGANFLTRRLILLSPYPSSICGHMFRSTKHVACRRSSSASNPFSKESIRFLRVFARAPSNPALAVKERPWNLSPPSSMMDCSLGPACSENLCKPFLQASKPL